MRERLLESGSRIWELTRELAILGLEHHVDYGHTCSFAFTQTSSRLHFSRSPSARYKTDCLPRCIEADFPVPFTASRTLHSPWDMLNPQAPDTWYLSPTYDRGCLTACVGLGCNGFKGPTAVASGLNCSPQIPYQFVQISRISTRTGVSGRHLRG